MTRGGVTPPIPPGTTAAQVFADSGCTTRPVAGGVYETLYVRLNRDFVFGDNKTYNDGQGGFQSLYVETPTTEDPDVPYVVILWVDWRSDLFDSSITAGSVIPVTIEDPDPLRSSFTVDFYDE